MATLSCRTLGTRSRWAQAIPVLALIFLLHPSARGASVVGPLDAVIGIDGLTVDGATLNVTFINTPFSTAFPANDPYYAGNTTGGIDAANAISVELTSAGAFGLAGDTTGVVGGTSIFVPVGLPSGLTVPTIALGQTPTCLTIWTGAGGVACTTGGARGPPSDTNVNLFTGEKDFWAVFAPASTGVGAPEPGTLALLGLGIVAVGLSRRRRTRARQGKAPET